MKDVDTHTAEELEEQAEAREWYGDAFPESKPPAGADGLTSATEYTETSEAASPVLATNHEQPSTNSAVNYHYLNTLTDEHLPDLDFYRIDNIFSAKSANAWLGDAAKVPVQRSLFGDFWNEGELSVLFADTGKGKSILAVQIAESIASGVAIQPFKLAAPAQRVLLFDFELDERQFGLRYSAAKRGSKNRTYFKFSDNLIRARIGPTDDVPSEYRNHYEYLEASVARLVEFTQARVVIVDNITWLNSSTQNSTAALRLMKVLKNLKTAFDLSILVLAHTPKRYHMSPLTINDLHGSKMLSNFADNIFALGESRMGRDLRYLKHLKLRNAAVRCDAANVCTLRLGKMPAINPPPTPLLRAKNLSEPPAVAGGCTPATENTEFTKTAFSSPATDNRPLTTDY